MNRVLLNEHDANQGAQSKGEFLGMAGQSAWVLLGSVGVTQIGVLVLWGMFDVSLMACLLVGLLLCLASLAYVFVLKNNRPAHFDTDFFESALIEAGLMQMAFGPREARPRNPFRSAGPETEPDRRAAAARKTPIGPRVKSEARFRVADKVDHTPRVEQRPSPDSTQRKDSEQSVPRATHERLQGELEMVHDQLEEALSSVEGDGVCA